MAADGARLQTAAMAIGGEISFDPRIALTRDAALNLQPPGLWSPNSQCRMVQTADGWIAVNLAREEDRATVPAWLGCALGDEVWSAVIERARQRTCEELLAQAHLLGMPVAREGEASLPFRPEPAETCLELRRAGLSVVAQSAKEESSPSTSSGRTERVFTAIDLSALWAGPYCGGLLAASGIAVTKIESPTRPDPTAHITPDLDARLNGCKRRLTMPLTYPALSDHIAASTILITSARPHALARLGLTPGVLFALNPRLIWVAITAYGWTGEDALRVGFGDDAAAAGGLVDWIDEAPHFIGDALADPLTGLSAAIAALQALAEGRSGLIDITLARTAAHYARLIARP
jgi:hypothetical protein